MEQITYTVHIEAADEGGYVAFVPILPGCHTQGRNLEEAVANAREAVELYLESLAARGKVIPVEHKAERGIAVGLTVSMPQAA